MPGVWEGCDPDEIEWVRRTCEGDRDAAAHLFTVILGPTLAAIARYWGCEDLADELFVHLSENGWHRLRTWNKEAGIKAWVRIVARRLCARMMKGPAPLTDLSIGEDCEIADDQSSVLDQLIKSERVMEVVNAIEELDSARDRALLRMFLFELRSPVEIATRLDCPVSRVYVIKTRAIKRLQLLLEGVTSDVDASGR